MTAGSGMSPRDDSGGGAMVLIRITLAAGFIAAAIGILGIAGLATGATLFTSVLPGYTSIAVSAALIWIFFGFVLGTRCETTSSGKAGSRGPGHLGRNRDH